MMSPAKTLLRAALIAGALLPLATVRPAAAATPCWKALLNDWYDGRIDNTYAIHCYTDALKHLPPDVQTYSSAHDDIERALQSAIAKLGKKKVNAEHADQAAADDTTTSTTPGRRREAEAASDGPDGGAAGTSRRRRAPAATPEAGSPGSRTSSIRAAPTRCRVPLLVLGGLALLLVAGGAGGLVVKHFRARRSGP